MITVAKDEDITGRAIVSVYDKRVLPFDDFCIDRDENGIRYINETLGYKSWKHLHKIFFIDRFFSRNSAES